MIERLFSLAQRFEAKLSEKEAQQTMAILENQIRELKKALEAAKTPGETQRLISKLQTVAKQYQYAKRKYNKSQKIQNLESFQSKLRNVSDPQEKRWLQEKIQLEQLQLSPDSKKREEITARKNLVNSLGNYDEMGNFHAFDILPEELQKLQEAIQTAESKKVLKQEYDREGTIQRSKEQGKIGPVPTRAPQRGGGRAGEHIHQFNNELATFFGLSDKLNEKVNTAIHAAKQGVTQIVTSERTKAHNELKPYVDQLSKAIQKGDRRMKYEAIKNLKDRIRAHPTRLEGLKILEKVARLHPYFLKMKNDLLQISKWVTESGKIQITPAKIAFILDTIQYSARLHAIYNRYYPEFGKTRLPYDATLKSLETVIGRLNEMIAASYKTLEESGATGPGGPYE